MNLTVILQDENGEIISQLNGEFRLDADLSQSILLKYLDPFGNTIFNALQAGDLISDLKLLSTKENNPLIKEIILLAERCKTESHTYLGFYGD